MAPSPPSNPLIAIVGATGTGKSKLAIEIAKRHNGEIINGDAMQLYAGLPIITNKVTTSEQEGIPHHLLGCIGLQEQTWVVGTFVRKALEKIREIRGRGRVPILVGGTHYYTQSLLLEDRLSEEEEKKEPVENLAEKFPILNEETELLLEELQRVDPVMAERWHPKDRRKIQRSLEIYLQTGKRASDIYSGQRTRREGEEQTATLRFPTLTFWVHAETEALRARLDDRVDKMLEQGLLHEVETLNAFAQEEANKNKAVDETRGIWVSIGYKEFKTYAGALHSSDTNQDERHMAKLKAEAIERTQISTRQYAKRQNRWIRIKLLNTLPPSSLYLLDASDLSTYTQKVIDPAVDLTSRFLRGEDLPPPSSLSIIAAEMLVPQREYDLSAAPEKWAKHYCEVCNVTCVTPEQWSQHTRSKTHKKLLSKRKIAEEKPDD